MILKLLSPERLVGEEKQAVTCLGFILPAIANPGLLTPVTCLANKAGVIGVKGEPDSAKYCLWFTSPSPPSSSE